MTMMMADEGHVSVRERTSSREGDTFGLGESSCEGGIPKIETEGFPIRVETSSATRASVPIVDFVG
jgi:hypothetical protein